MSTPRLIWCHGSLSQPWGTKSRHLAKMAESAGLTMDALDFQDQTAPDDRVSRLKATLAESDTPTILCGSSMGGYVASAAAKDSNILGLFLLAPAFYLSGYATHVFSGLPRTISVIHGWNDDVVPVDNSIRFAGQHRAELHVVPDDHRLSNSLDMIGREFSRFLELTQDGE